MGVPRCLAIATCDVVAGVQSASAPWTQAKANVGRNSFVGGDFDPSKLEPVWDLQLDPPATSSAGFHLPESGVATNDQVYRTFKVPNRSEEYAVIAVDLTTGQENWRRILFSSVVGGVGEPTITDGKVWVTRAGHSLSNSRYRRTLYGFSSISGETLSETTYSAQFGYGDCPTTNGDLLIARDGYFGGVSSFSAVDGTGSWRVDGPSSLPSPRAVLTDNYVFVTSSRVHAIESGDLITTVVHPDQKLIRRPQITPSGTLVYMTIIPHPVDTEYG